MGGKHSDESRRSFLKSTGLAASGLAAIGSAGLVSGKNDKIPPGIPPGQKGRKSGIPEAKYKALLRKRKRKGWSTNRWRSELANHGAGFNYMDSGVQVNYPSEGVNATSQSSERPSVTVERLKPIDERNDDSEVGINNVDQDTLKLELTYTNGYLDRHYNWHKPRIDYSWSMKDPWIGGADLPRDQVMLSIDDEQYDWGYDVVFGNEAKFSDKVDAKGFGHRCASYNADWASDNSIGRFGSFMDAPIMPKSGSPATRTMYINYVCLYEEAEIQSMTVSSGGEVSVTISNVDKAWRAETFADEDQMDNGDPYVKDDW